MEGGHLHAGRSGKQAEEAAPAEWLNVAAGICPRAGARRGGTYPSGQRVREGAG
jgi:hypothetical protein